VRRLEFDETPLRRIALPPQTIRVRTASWAWQCGELQALPGMDVAGAVPRPPCSFASGWRRRSRCLGRLLAASPPDTAWLENTAGAMLRELSS
jgi:hypothetical protein